MKKLVAAALCAALSVSACASSPENIAAQYVSPLQYQAYDCVQIRAELVRISGRVSALTGQQRQDANNDAMLVAATIVIFWPAAFFVGGNKAKADELARLKGEYEALQVVGTQKNCGVS